MYKEASPGNRQLKKTTNNPKASYSPHLLIKQSMDRSDWNLLVLKVGNEDPQEAIGVPLQNFDQNHFNHLIHTVSCVFCKMVKMCEKKTMNIL